VRGLLVAAAADLADAGRDLSPGWRFAIAYHAALRLGTAVLLAAGYRASRDPKHYRTFAVLPLLLGDGVRELADFLDRCRARRHEVAYESASSVSAEEAAELAAAAEELEGHWRAWLATRMPEALSGS
jgi:uncharacterized protein (UPF0332 family)